MAVSRDARHPDTQADKDPRAFGTIDPAGAEDAAKAGPGVIDPTQIDAADMVDENGNSTFASRAAARRRAERGETKAVQRSENK